MSSEYLEYLKNPGRTPQKKIEGKITGYVDIAPDAEKDNEISQFEAAMAGVISGVIKIPEGFVSLGAELTDAFGLTANAAARVEQVFDKINPFEEVAEQKAAGKITEALVQIGVPSTIGAKIASKLATKALKARKAGTYVNLKSPNVRKGMEKVYRLNDAARIKRFGAAVAGGAAGEVFVADVENIGTIGDALRFGPTQLEVDAEVDYEGAAPDDPQKDAVRKLMNRLKFGADSVAYFPFIFGGLKAASKVATFGKELAFSSSKINKTIDSVASAVRPTSDKPTAVFLAKMREGAGQGADANFAMEQVKRIDKEVGKMFPSVKSFFLKNGVDNKVARDNFYKDLKELMFEGNLQDKLGNTKIFKKVKKQMDDSNLSKPSQKIIFDGIYNTRQKFVRLLETIKEGSTGKVTLPGELKKMPGLLSDRVKLMLSNTYRIFENPVIDNLSAYRPAKDKIDKVKEILKRHAQRNGRELTEDQLDYRINEILKTATKITPKTQLPSFKMTNLTVGAKDPETRKSFVQLLSKKQKNGETVTQIIGKGSKAFRELFGEVDDARESIFNGIGLLSTIAKRSELIDDLLRVNDEAIEKGTRQLFYSDKNDAIKFLGAGGLNDIVELDAYLKPLFKDGVLLNRLKGLYTTREIAEAFDPVNKISDFFVGQKKTKVGKFAGSAYKNLFLVPKAGAQVAKTVLSPTTHMRNFLSASAFSLANGTLFTNPKLFASAFADAVKTVQIGLRSPKAMADYREMLELGVVNTNTKMGDYQSLLKDLSLDPNAPYSDNMFQRILKRMARLTEGPQRLYTAEDDIYKIFNFKVETARLKDAYLKAGIKKTERQLKEEAADIVRNTVPNYAYVSDVVKSLRSTPFSNFASFPAAIMTSGTGIFSRILKELRHSKPTKGPSYTPMVFEVGKGMVKNDNPLFGIGMKRLLGAASAFGTLGIGINAGYHAIQGTNSRQEQALDRWVPGYEKGDKKFISKEEQPDGSVKYYYQNWSANNAYDFLEQPFRTLLRSVQEGIETEQQLSVGFVKGISDGFKKFSEPFVTESIAPEALFDILLRGGVTREGTKLYTDATPLVDRINIISRHILKTQMPFSQSQVSRIYYSMRGLPTPTGTTNELANELPGLLGWRLIEINPVRGLNFKITDLNTKTRNATREFTNDRLSRILSGGVNTSDEIIRQFFIANRALFDAQQGMFLDLKAANEFEVSDQQLAAVFEERDISVKRYGPLFLGAFQAYIPSDNILGKLQEIDNKNGTDALEKALPVLREMVEQFNNMPLDKPFRFKLNDFVPETETQNRSALPETPPINSAIIQPVQQASVSQTGLTPSEQALLSPEEQAIRLRQRGMA
jgi:hypothetical protein